ncbi:hypothetical protein I302_102186 [Kwoniella bestiolae CBS 10118]|uniref:Uncharacterized protein n=1 Tax=Kwoniella bestiolae CBS 10118 TaxID=1296100 RepID=A0A1B9GEI3_9TREE|nr:hypothetical protein I302_00873 [Kwoniella bestiolae CBS 10118]OCF29371.1 hypothetical protein I302_00873 [Kwoniella bestiolae CBS 10118]
MPIIFTSRKSSQPPSSSSSPPIPGPNGGYQSPKIIDPSFVLPQALLGGEDSIEALHWYHPGLPQEEVQVRIWEGWNLEITHEGVVDRGRECRMQVVLSFQAALEDPKPIKHHYIRAIQFHEEYVKCELIKMIRFVESALDGRSSGSILAKLIRKKEKDGGVGKSLEESVAEGEGWKVKGNLAGKNGKHEQAIRHYLEGLIALWPYTSSDTSMSYEKARESGLVKLEQALLNNIITISLSHPSKTGPKRTTFDNIARVTCEVILEFRYLTITSLRKTFERLAQLDEREYGIQGKQGVDAFMAELFKGKDGDEWAHRNCVREHVCHE